MNKFGLCPFCSQPLPGISQNDGGSLVCLTCGSFHHCVDGPVKGGPGPSLCPKCMSQTQPPFAPFGRPRTSVPPPASVWCDGCNISIPSIPGSRWKCRQCHDFDFCKNCIATKQHDNRHVFFEVNPSTDTSSRNPQFNSGEEMHSR